MNYHVWILEGRSWWAYLLLNLWRYNLLLLMLLYSLIKRLVLLLVDLCISGLWFKYYCIIRYCS